jgi:dephospho-CoA kinase
MAMLKVGITGGIGSGKTTVCRVFETLGIPVFYADTAAKVLMDTDLVLIRALKALFGEDIYKDGKLDRQALASSVFADKELLNRLNAVVHPATIAHGRKWMSGQTTPYAIKEAALFFESGTAADMDVMIGVTADIDTRISRVMTRDNATRESIVARISKQMDDAEKMRLCDFVITNDDRHPIVPQVLALHEQLLRTAREIASIPQAS